MTEQRQATVRVILKDEQEQKEWEKFLIWEAVECPPENNDHYGNGYYISITRKVDNYHTLIDCRYQKYDFTKIVIDNMNAYYGKDRIKEIVFIS